MKLSIPLKIPKTTYKLFRLTWFTFLVIALCIFCFVGNGLPLYIKAGLLVLITALGLLSLKQLDKNCSQAGAIYWDGSNWFLLVNQNKQLIELTDSTRVLGSWILLGFRFNGTNKGIQRQLFLPKDSMLETNFRNLSRTLRFLSTKDSHLD